MSSRDIVYLTQEGFETLSQELEHLKSVRRLEVAERLHNALGEGELIENAELEIARSEQAFVEGRILDLEERLRKAQIISRNGPNTDVVAIGSTVKVKERGESDEEEYFVVGSSEADPSNGRISNESPLGRALIGKRVGSNAVVRAPDGDLVFEIISIS
ncbi:MAG: transcription elongation factor GreA [Anaerolineae bacterium]|jgi:transcription elongation factor GreA|nr:transcription elongation factor GreA [Anaerolineae bacterium]